MYGMPLQQNFAGGRTLGSGRLQPRTKLSGCSTCLILSHVCIGNICVGSHPLCPKWASAWHRRARSKKYVFHSQCTVDDWVGSKREVFAVFSWRQMIVLPIMRSEV